MSISQELQKYYEERFNMMSTLGWKDLIEDAETMFKAYNHLTSVSNAEQLFFKKGQLDILNWILTLKEVSEKSYEELNETNL